jgi:FkbM family methyltransferase
MEIIESSTDALERVLAGIGPPEDILVRERGAYAAIAQGATNIVIFGYGFLGKLALSSAINAGSNVVAIADNDPSHWGQTPGGVPVMSPQEAIRRHNADAAFVVAIFNGTPARRQLAELGCTRIIPYPIFHWEFSRFIATEDGLELPHRILDSVNDLRRAYQLLSDAASRAEFAAQVRWRCSIDYDCLSPPGSLTDMYYAPDLVRLRPDEVLVDCGAFDGDSIRAFIGRAGGRFRHIYALEPDAKNRNRLESCLVSEPKHVAERITVFPFAVGERDTTVFFNPIGAMGSRIAADGAESVECRKLDGLIEEPAPTFIKLDVEGAELEAIQGAVETIQKVRPILAVCAYHKCAHLWKIPLLLHSLLPEYRFFFRRYAEECWETMYYAIPPERLIPGDAS